MNLFAFLVLAEVRNTFAKLMSPYDKARFPAQILATYLDR